MNRDGHENTVFFIGPEVEHTPAFSKKTLFVVGKPPLAEITKQAKDNGVHHIFMGANHSFDAQGSAVDNYWDKTITALLDSGIWVSLDYPAHQHETVLKMLNAGIWQSRIFVPLLSVRIPHIETSSPNLTVKIDDVDFNATNPGVWCMHFHEVTDSNRFTGWTEYESDEIITQVEKVVEPITQANKEIVAPATRATETTAATLKNDVDAGLDPISASKLKPDPQEAIAKVTEPIDAAKAYAEGATEDPLSKLVKPAKKAKGE